MRKDKWRIPGIPRLAKTPLIRQSVSQIDYSNYPQIVVVTDSPSERLYIRRTLMWVDSSLVDEHILYVNSFQEALGIQNPIPLVFAVPYYASRYSSSPIWGSYNPRISVPTHEILGVCACEENILEYQELFPEFVVVTAGKNGVGVWDSCNSYEFCEIAGGEDIYPILDVVQDGAYARFIGNVPPNPPYEMSYYFDYGGKAYITGVSGFQNNLPDGLYSITQSWTYPNNDVGIVWNLGSGALTSNNVTVQGVWLSGAVAVAAAKINLIRKLSGCSLAQARHQARVSGSNQTWNTESGYGYIQVNSQALPLNRSAGSMIVQPVFQGDVLIEEISRTTDYVDFFFPSYLFRTSLTKGYAKSLELFGTNGFQGFDEISFSGSYGHLIPYSHQGYIKDTCVVQARVKDSYGNETIGSLEMTNNLTVKARQDQIRALPNQHKLLFISPTSYENVDFFDSGELVSVNSFSNLLDIENPDLTYTYDYIGESGERDTLLQAFYANSKRWNADTQKYLDEAVPAKNIGLVPAEYMNIQLAIADGKNYIKITEGSYTGKYDLPDHVDLEISDGATITGSDSYVIKALGSSNIFGRGVISATNGYLFEVAATGYLNVSMKNTGVGNSVGLCRQLGNGEFILNADEINCNEGLISYGGDSVIDVRELNINSTAFKMIGNGKVCLVNSDCSCDQLFELSHASSRQQEVICSRVKTRSGVESSVGSIAHCNDNQIIVSDLLYYYWNLGVVNFVYENRVQVIVGTSSYENLLFTRKFFKDRHRQFGTVSDNNGICYYINLDNINSVTVDGNNLTIDNLTITCTSGFAVKHKRYLDKLVEGRRFLSTFQGTWLHVGSGQQYSTINEAVRNFQSGNAIRVHVGEYREAVPVIDGLKVYYDPGAFHYSGHTTDNGGIHAIYYNKSISPKYVDILGYGSFDSDTGFTWNDKPVAVPENRNQGLVYWEFSTMKSNENRSIFCGDAHLKISMKGFSHRSSDGSTYTSFCDTDEQIEADFDICEIREHEELIFQPYSTVDAKCVFRNVDSIPTIPNLTSTLVSNSPLDYNKSDYLFISVLHDLTQQNVVENGFLIYYQTSGLDTFEFCQCVFIRKPETELSKLPFFVEVTTGDDMLLTFKNVVFANNLGNPISWTGFDPQDTNLIQSNDSYATDTSVNPRLEKGNIRVVCSLFDSEPDQPEFNNIDVSTNGKNTFKKLNPFSTEIVGENYSVDSNLTW